MGDQVSERKPLERLDPENFVDSEGLKRYPTPGELSLILNEAIDHINQLEARLELGHHHMYDADPVLYTSEDIAYMERDEDE